MKETKGYVAFINNKDIKKGDIINENIIVYPTIPDSLRCCKIEDEKQITEVSIMGDYTELSDDEYGRMLTSKIKILNILEYDEIVNNVLNGNKNFKHLMKFISAFKLTLDDQDKFSLLGYHTWLAVECYQKKDNNIYKDAVKEEKKTLKRYENFRNRKKD